MPSKPLSPVAVAALGCLRERPMHPYEMFQLTMHRQADRVVKLTPGSLYRTVYALEEQGLVEVTGVERDGSRPEKTSYRITETGSLALLARLCEMLEEPVNEYPAYGQALAEAHNLPASDVVDRLRARSAALHALLGEIDRTLTWLHDHAVPERFWFNLGFTRAAHQAELAWTDETIARIESGALDWEEAPTGAAADAVRAVNWNGRGAPPRRPYG